VGKKLNIIEVFTDFDVIFVEMRNACQVTNQSSHGELSFHHNPLPSAFAGACASLLLALFGAVAQE
tara:strand:- start:249 stop:446 length:198 start_codon:yes stop_codon:yes gene_type:complete